MKPITIAGGGLSGLALGIGLLRRNVPVTLFESGYYPRHRVCGEFISGRGRDALAELELEEKIFAAGAREAHSVAFFSRRATGKAQALPRPALCLSRYILDKLLADEFRRAGGRLCQEQRWAGGYGEGVVRASGRRIASDPAAWRWFGLKTHARGVDLASDLEVHLTPKGYVGLCRIDAETVNICGLFRARNAIPDLMHTWREWLSGSSDSVLHDRVAGANFLDGTFCSVAGLQPVPSGAVNHAEFCVGDAIAMIPPLTGNGMSMAFESAALATTPLVAFSAGKMAWEESCHAATRLFQNRFQGRLRCAAWLQEALFHETMAAPLIWLGSRWGGLWRALFERTR